MKQSAEIALLAQGLGLAYVIAKGENTQAFFIASSMLATYLATREAVAKETLQRKGAFDEPNELGDYVAALRAKGRMPSA